jgi:predicted Ser/Thr protein kinase
VYKKGKKIDYSVRVPKELRKGLNSLIILVSWEI